MKSLTKYFVWMLLLLVTGVLTAQNHKPAVTNVDLKERTDGSMLVDVYYDVNDSDGNAMTVTMLASSDSGSTWNLTCNNITGAIGSGITSGTGKHIVWDFGVEHPNFYSNKVIVEISADDGITSVPAGMVLVTGGTFTMGSTNTLDYGASPTHSVTLSSYYMSKTEVTQGQWKAVMGINPSYFPGVGDNGPVEQVSWYACISYCNKLSIKEGKTPVYSIGGNTSPSSWTSGTIVFDTTAKGYRLPTEAEWEYAARGGTQSHSYTYSGSNNVDSVAWYYSNSGSTTHQVSTRTANELGISDMSGNVWEWCWDWYGAYSSTAQTNPTGASSGSGRLLRGGSWSNDNYDCRVSIRGYYDPGSNIIIIGFRVVEDL